MLYIYGLNNSQFDISTYILYILNFINKSHVMAKFPSSIVCCLFYTDIKCSLWLKTNILGNYILLIITQNYVLVFTPLTCLYLIFLQQP